MTKEAVCTCLTVDRIETCGTFEFEYEFKLEYVLESIRFRQSCLDKLFMAQVENSPLSQLSKPTVCENL